MKVLLASSSTWRKQLLESTGIFVQCVPPEVDEILIVGETPIQTAVQRAKAKALWVWSNFKETSVLVIGADQVCHLDGQSFGKPENPQQWFERLRLFRGRTHTLSTGVHLKHSQGEESFVCHTKVQFRQQLSDQQLWDYVHNGEAAGCAGGYMMEGRGAWLIERIEGDWQNVIGLPIFPLLSRLQGLGIEPFDEDKQTS